MNDKDFDKIFGDKLREERPFFSQDKDWEQLSPRLDTAPFLKKEDNRWRTTTLLLLLLLPILPFLFWQMNDIKKQNQQLAIQLADLQAQLTARNVQHDTIVQKIQKTDTLVIYKYIHETKRADKKKGSFNSSSQNTSQNKEKSPFLTPYTEGYAKATQNDFLNKETSVFDNSKVLSVAKTSFSQDTTPQKNAIEEKHKAELIEKLAALDKQITDLKQALIEQKLSAEHLADCATKQDSLKKQLAKALAISDSLQKHPLPKESGSAISIEAPKTDKSLKNNRLFIGVHGGQINYKTTWISGAGVDIYKNYKSYQAGLKLEYALTDKIRLTAGGDFCPFSFLIFWQDKRYNLPALQFDATKEKYQKAEAKQTLVQGNLGIKYFFTEGGQKWRPFVSTAYSMMRINPFETKFTYTPLWGTVIREQTVPSKAVNIPNLLLLNGGLEYRFSKYAVAQAEAFYYKDINKTKETFDLFGLRAAILMGF